MFNNRKKRQPRN